MRFRLYSQFKPTGDQPHAIAALVRGAQKGYRKQTLLGVTGSGKTFTAANAIARLQRPVLVVSHNKTLASQLYQEFRAFFPENAVHYFVSYYDYYLPEAYIPQTDTYIEKDAKINEIIDRLRHATTQDVLMRKDVIVVASVSCIYGIGSPAEYRGLALSLKRGMRMSRRELSRVLAYLQYERADMRLIPGCFRVRGDSVEISPMSGADVIRVELLGDIVASLERSSYENAHPITQRGEALREITLFPAKHFVTPQNKLRLALCNIERELAERLGELRRTNRILEAERLARRTRADIEMLREFGYCHGIENYSRHLSFRGPGEPPYTLLDFFPKDFLTFIDESHMTIPQLRAMYCGDRARKKTLVEYGFRLPSALDNRPLRFEEFEERIGDAIFVSATPGPYELKKSAATSRGKSKVVEQLLRPTGLLDPKIEIHPAKNQMDHLAGELRKRCAEGERALVLVITKRLAEDVCEYLRSRGFRAAYLHSEIHTLARPRILHDLSIGTHDVLVGVNLLREGIDLPMVSLVAILDADKEGFLRNETTLIQMMGRAARHQKGKAILYADHLTTSLRKAIKETRRRRALQLAYNKKHHITPKTIKQRIRKLPPWLHDAPPAPERPAPRERLLASLPRAVGERARVLESEMRRAAQKLDFEYAASLRDLLKELRKSDRVKNSYKKS